MRWHGVQLDDHQTLGKAQLNDDYSSSLSEPICHLVVGRCRCDTCALCGGCVSIDLHDAAILVHGVEEGVVGLSKTRVVEINSPWGAITDGDLSRGGDRERQDADDTALNQPDR